MSILIANIGTSDIAIKVGDYYLPIGFDRSEPNLEEPSPNTPEGAAWRERQALVDQQLQADLKIAPRARYRYACEAILSAYRADPEIWHPRISIGRLQGVINSALEAEAKGQGHKSMVTAHLIVTDQPETEVRGYPTDTLYAFDIIQAWLSRQLPALVSGESAPIKLVPSIIRVPAVHEDLLHEHYYQLFQTFTPDDIIYLSVKGGTYQMQQALKVQALASNTKAQIFLSPKPQVSKILAGEPSDCQRIAYWRYQQNQKYQTVQLLLDRWDFAGAAALLEAWEGALQATVADNQAELDSQKHQVKRTIKGLQLAVAHMNLDAKAARDIATDDAELELLHSQFDNLTEDLFTQCRIYFKIERISTFLAYLGSFYEASQESLINSLDGLPYFGKNYQEKGVRYIFTRKLERENPLLLNCVAAEFGWRLEQYPRKPKLGNRYLKWKFINGLIAYKQASTNASFSLAQDYWKALDFWCEVRNQLIHGAKGINKNRLEEVYAQRDITEAEAQAACPYDEILPTMKQILAELCRLHQADGHVVSWCDPGYGLYGQIQDWALVTLKN